MNTKLELNNVSREVNGKILLDKISLAVPEGTVAAIIGPSGAGKVHYYH